MTAAWVAEGRPCSSSSSDGSCAGLIASEHLGGTRPLHLPGDPHRGLYTAARAGSTEHPSLLAFRAALLEAASGVEDLQGVERLSS